MDFITSKGKFWLNDFNSYEFRRLMNYGLRTKKNKWNKDNEKIIQKLISYDPGNIILKKIISKIEN